MQSYEPVETEKRLLQQTNGQPSYAPNPAFNQRAFGPESGAFQSNDQPFNPHPQRTLHNAWVSEGFSATQGDTGVNGQNLEELPLDDNESSSALQRQRPMDILFVEEDFDEDDDDDDDYMPTEDDIADDLYEQALDLGEQYAFNTKGNQQLSQAVVRQAFADALQNDDMIKDFYDDFSEGFQEGYRDYLVEKGWILPEQHDGGQGSLYEKKDNPNKNIETLKQVYHNEQQSIFVPEINQASDSADEEDAYDHAPWINLQQIRNQQAADIAINHVSGHESIKHTEIFLNVIKTGISTNRAVYTPKVWMNEILPMMHSTTKKEIAAEIFSQWMDEKSMDETNIAQLNLKLQSLETQFDLDVAKLIYTPNSEHNLYAELKASPSIFVPVNTTKISGGAAVAGKADKLDAVQYDGPELSPLGQFLDHMNTHYLNAKYSAADKLPKVTKSITLLNGSSDDVTAKFYRPGTVEAISTKTRGTGRSGSGETKVGRMGVQEELINTGILNAGQYQGGHLIGDQIMNPKQFDLYQTWNLAPQEQDFNSPIYSGLEGGATKAVDNGGELHITANVSYPSDTYSVSVIDLVDRLLMGNTAKVGTSAVTWHQAIQGAQKLDASLPKNLDFMTRVPGYWHIHAEDTNKKGAMQSNFSLRTQGLQVVTALDATSVYNPVGTQRYQYAMFTGGDSKTGTVVPAATAAKGTSYKGADEVSLYARQKTAVIGTASLNINTMTVTQLNAVVKNSTVASAIKTWMTTNAPTATKDLLSVKGVGKATLAKINAASLTV